MTGKNPDHVMFAGYARGRPLYLSMGEQRRRSTANPPESSTEREKRLADVRADGQAMFREGWMAAHRYPARYGPAVGQYYREALDEMDRWWRK